MAFSKNDPITAEKLNEINLASSLTWSSSVPQGSWVYSPSIYMRSGGHLDIYFERFYVSGIGDRIGGIWSISRYENGEWREKVHEEAEGQWPGATFDYYVSNMGGEGYYKLSMWLVTASVGSGPKMDGKIYASRKTSYKGEYLVAYTDPSVSGNRVPGIPLTVDILNSGNVNTLPNL